MKVLITGGAGFIGSNLARYLLDQQEITSIKVLDDLSTGDIRNLAGLDVDFTEGSILDRDTLHPIVADVDSVVHLAAIPSVPRSIAHPQASHAANASGTLSVLEAARSEGVEHVVVASSSSVYGSNPKLPKNENDWTRPMSPYAASKLAAESYTLAYQSSYGMKTLAFRFFNVFGPGQAADHAYAAVVPKFLSAALRGEPVELHGDGLQTRDFTYVRTVCAVLHEAVARRVHDVSPVNLAYGTSTTLLDLLAIIETQLGASVERRVKDARTGDVRGSQADGRRIRELFPAVTPTPLEDGIRDTIAWFRSLARD